MAPPGPAVLVADALRHLGMDARASGPELVRCSRPDLEPIIVTLDQPRPDAGSQIVVSTRMTPRLAHELDAAGIGWLDITGHIRFHFSDVWIDADVPGVVPHPSPRRMSPLAGRVVSAVSMAALLAWPDSLPGVRALAREIEATPGGVSQALRRLIDIGLLTEDRRAMPALFWTIADEWRPRWVELPVEVVPTDAVAVGHEAAAMLGAPVAMRAGGPIELLVGDAADLHIAALTAEVRGIGSGPMARVALAPSPGAAAPPHDGQTLRGFRIGQEALVALPMAIDPSRGAETVRAWGGSHVW